MNVEFVARRVRLSTRVTDLVETKLAKLEKVLPQAAQGRVVIQREKLGVTVEITITARQRTFSATEVAQDQEAATHAALERSTLLRRFAPLLGMAAAAVGSPQIRARGTVGGNVMNAATCADTVPALVALGARLTLQSAAGRRALPIAEFFVKPYVTVARPDEVLTDVEFPALPADARSAFVKLGRRNALAIARLSVAAVVRRGPDGRVVEARIVPGAALPVWKRVTAAEALLVGEAPTPERLAAAGRQVAEVMVGETGRRWSTEYKEPVVAALARRALEACCAGPAGGAS